MRSGFLRGVTLAIALMTALGASTASADGLETLFNPHPVIPRVAPAVDYRTGGEYFMPPVPYGCYAKDPLGKVAGACGLAKGLLCGACGGLGCGLCKGGLGHGNDCGGSGCGLGHGHGHGGACGGSGCGLGHGHGHGGACGGSGCGLGNGGGLFHKHGDPCSDGACGIAQAGGIHQHGGPASYVMPTSQGMPTSQAACGACGGSGCNFCGNGGLHGDPGHGLGHGLGKGGLFHGRNKGCGACGGRGCGLCGGGGGMSCGACGGAGCGLCAKAHGALGAAHGLLYSALHPHAGKIDYFVGAGGPVPLTPGYVPYVVPVRSPRDFLAFPPYGPLDP